MRRTAGWSVVAACLVVLGCATPRGSSRAAISSECHGASCEIDVSVECVSGACAATADKKILVVNDRGAVVIQWNLRAGPDFRFADTGVRFSSGTPLQCNRPQPAKITCVDTNQGPGTYEYKLDVVRTGNPSTTIPVDPYFVNR